MINEKIDLILCIFLGWCGVHKFYEGDIKAGLIYLFTFGLFGIGWIVDFINMCTGRYTVAGSVKTEVQTEKETIQTLSRQIYHQKEDYERRIEQLENVLAQKNSEIFDLREKFGNTKAHDLEKLEFDYDSMNGWQFEEFCSKILQNNGYDDVSVTSGSGDFGADIIAYKDGEKYVIQCKNYSGKVGNKAIQEIFSAKAYYKADIAVVMTNNYFTDHAIEHANGTNVLLWDKDILDKMIGNIKIRINKNCGEIEEKTNEEVKKVWDNKEEGIYPAGVYVVGEDIEIGRYLLIAKIGESQDPKVTFYEDYSKYRKNAINQIERFKEEYYLSLRENGMVIAVRDADIKRL